MPRLRPGFYLGLIIGVSVALFCLRLWLPERQVNLHTEHLFHKLEQRNWSAVGDFIDAGYADQWNDDRSLLIERMRAAFSYARNLHVRAEATSCVIDGKKGTWRGKIKIVADAGELGIFAEQRINSLGSPFELEWRRVSAKPWDWKLVRVSNPELDIPADF